MKTPPVEVRPNARAVMEMLLAGKIDEATAFIEGPASLEIAVLESKLQDAIQERNLLRTMVSLATMKPLNQEDSPRQPELPEMPPPVRPALNPSARWPFPTGTRVDNPVTARRVMTTIIERRNTVKECAVEIALGHQDRRANVQDIVDRLKSKGIDLGVEVPNTAVGNILKQAREWNRIDRGVFEYLGDLI